MTSNRKAVSYGDWNLPYMEALATFTESEARRRDVSGEEYWVLLGGQERPDQVIRVSAGRVNVLIVWLDEHLREVLTYLFVPEDKSRRDDHAQRLFLEQVHFKAYGSDDPFAQPVEVGATFFEHDGSAYHSQDLGNGLEEGRTGPMDPAEAERMLFEPHPSFGDWASIARRER